MPHRHKDGLLQSVTFRLADSLPRRKLDFLEAELALDCVPDGRKEAERRKRIERWLDAGMGCCALGHPDVADYVQNSLIHFHGERYALHAWCVMPNHVHVLVEPWSEMWVIVQGWKSFTARWALKQNEALALGIPDESRLWMREYWDRFIRSREHYENVVAYIEGNPVKAGLCEKAQDWRWSSGSAGVRADLVGGGAEGENRADGDVGAPGG